MESKSIIVSILSELQKIFTSFRDIVGMDDYIEIAKICSHKYTAFPFLFFDHVVYFIPDLWFFKISKWSDTFCKGIKISAS